MKRIEDRFQKVANRILSSRHLDLNDQEFDAIAEFYSLWQARAEHRYLPEQDIKLEGAVSGMNVLSMNERERLEKHGAFVIPGDGTFLMRDANSIIVTFSIYKHKAELPSVSWGLIEACDGEFCVPDKPTHGVLPLTPSLALRVGSPSGRITRDDLADLNRSMFECAKEYVFARDLAKCPGISISHLA